jgi:hypothetical protein
MMFSVPANEHERIGPRDGRALIIFCFNNSIAITGRCRFRFAKSSPPGQWLPARSVTSDGFVFSSTARRLGFVWKFQESRGKKPAPSIRREIAFDCCQPHAGFVRQNRERKRQPCLKEDGPQRETPSPNADHKTAPNTHTPTTPALAQPAMT